MPKAEVGSTKFLNNKLKSKGLQRLRWYCQVCERQMRDENGFKMHTQSESHVRQMLLVGEDPKKYIKEYSRQFQQDFLQLLRTAHGEKMVNLNHFYNEYISNKEHVHMNATRWPSLTEFAKFLGREGLCRVEADEDADSARGIQIAWIDNSPEALRRSDAIRKRERQDRGDEQREQAMIRDQVRRANRDAAARAGLTTDSRDQDELDDEEERQLKRLDGEKIKLSFGAKAAAASVAAAEGENENELQGEKKQVDSKTSTAASTGMIDGLAPNAAPKAAPLKVGLSLGGAGASKPKNVFAAAAKKNKNVLAGSKVSSSILEPPKRMSEAERIMREELDQQKRKRESSSASGSGIGFLMSKKPRF